MYTGGLWCRFQRGLPRKMGGYKTLSQSMTAISRALHVQTSSGYSYVHSGFAAGIEAYQIDQFGNTSAPYALTPGGFANNANNIWQLDSYYDINSAKQQILAFVVPGLADIAYGDTTGALYAGPIYTTAALTSVSGLATDATGGIVMLPPYLCAYGSNGLFQWSVAAKPLDLVSVGSGAARITDQKIVRALPLLGNAGFSPSCLAWTMNGVIKVYFVGGGPVFAFDPLTVQSSTLSHNGICQAANGLYYWVAQDRFMLTNGQTVEDLPNNTNLNFFFDNLNRTYAQKVFAFYNARWGEVWFCAPLFGATEPNWAVIYNDREKNWYDTPLPNSGRSFGVKSDLGSGMLMSGIDIYNSLTYRLWQHEFGTDQDDGPFNSAVRSYFDTAVITAANFQQPLDRSVKIDTLEPDFVQSGDMTVTAFTRGNPRAAYQASDAQTFADTAASIQDQQVPLKTSAKQTKLRFESNVAGGDYQAGKTLAYIEVDQGRRTS